MLELKREHGEKFTSTCERLHTGVDFVPAYVQAILDPRSQAAAQAERFTELVAKSDIPRSN